MAKKKNTQKEKKREKRETKVDARTNKLLSAFWDYGGRSDDARFEDMFTAVFKELCKLDRKRRRWKRRAKKYRFEMPYIVRATERSVDHQHPAQDLFEYTPKEYEVAGVVNRFVDDQAQALEIAHEVLYSLGMTTKKVDESAGPQGR